MAKGPGRPRKSWSDTVTQDHLQNIEMTWTDYGETAVRLFMAALRSRCGDYIFAL